MAARRASRRDGHVWTSQIEQKRRLAGEQIRGDLDDEERRNLPESAGLEGLLHCLDLGQPANADAEVDAHPLSWDLAPR